MYNAQLISFENKCYKILEYIIQKEKYYCITIDFFIILLFIKIFMCLENTISMTSKASVISSNMASVEINIFRSEKHHPIIETAVSIINEKIPRDCVTIIIANYDCWELKNVRMN